MKLLRGFRQLSELSLGTAATIGNFDGVHRGHQALLKKLRYEADCMHLPMLVMLFEPQPSEYFEGSSAKARLSSLREKIDVFRQCGVDYVYCLKFDRFIASMSANEFAERMIYSLLQTNYLLVGEDFRFGCARQGDVTLLCELGRQYSCVVEYFPDFFIDNQRVSSTKIRQYLQLGEVEYAATLLGRPYSICGRVIKGDGRGRTWGIPTANVLLHHNNLPLKGVYSVRVLREGKPGFYGVANIGNRPTIEGSKYSLEVHLFDVDLSLYGEMIQVCFLHKLRDELKFSSVEALIDQIHNDIATAKAYCADVLMRIP